MSEVWLLEAYDDPYIAPYTIGVFESNAQLIDAVNNEYKDAVDIRWAANNVDITFEVKSMFSNEILRTDRIRLEFRPFPVGEIYG